MTRPPPLAASLVTIAKQSDHVYFPTSQGITSEAGEYATWMEELKTWMIGNELLIGQDSLFAVPGRATIEFRVIDVMPKSDAKDQQYTINESTELKVIHACSQVAECFVSKAYDTQQMELKSFIESSLFQHDLYEKIGMIPSKSILISGPSGVGKSHIISQVLRQLAIASFTVNVLDLVAFLTRIDKLGTPADKDTICPLKKAINRANCALPSAIVITGLDLLCNEPPGLDLQYSTCIDRIISLTSAIKSGVCLIATCQQSEKLPLVFKKRGPNSVFNTDLILEVPSRNIREQIALSMLQSVNLDPSDKALENVSGAIVNRYAYRIAQETAGFVARDIKQLITRAIGNANLRKLQSDSLDLTDKLAAMNLNPSSPPPNHLQNASVSWTLDFVKVIPYITASQASDTGFDMSKADLRWDDIGGYDQVKAKLQALVINPLENPQSYERLGIKPPAGILLYGPSGCGKSLLVRTLGSNCPLNFISVNGSKIFSKYLGESEATVRRIFELARKVAPCIIFFDEIDILGVRREWSEDGASGVNERVLSTLLNEMDGVAEQKGVIVIGSTNRPDKLDDALLRPGRLNHHVHVSLPSLEDRKAILDTLLRDGIHTNLDTLRVAKATDGFTPADLMVLIREAKYFLLRECESEVRETSGSLEWKHVAAALSGALKGDLNEVFKRAFEEQEEGTSEAHEKEAAFWKSFGGDINGTWGISAFQQTVAEAAEMNAILSLRPGRETRGGAGGAWWRPGTITEEEALKFEKFAKGSKK
ncbi:P-loop containing nucleoside triphosphate hydrolase protein [Obelidium mucronatum]|nr:P-loop containing nucleoside triphosphate hydrolase protein [Obelidium mucronatum]